MLALYRASLRPHTVRRHRAQSPPVRSVHIQNLCDGFLDLALALPIPPSFPAYSTTIILVTVLSRCALLPISIWGKRRVQRVEELVIPEIESCRSMVAKRVIEGMKAAGVQGSKQELQAVHFKQTMKILTAKRKELYKKYNCSLLPSILIPPLSQLPLFVVFTVVLNRLSQDPTPFDSESFLTLTSLAHPDPTMTLPVLLGFLTMANVESGNWVMNAAEREQQRAIEAEEAKRVASGGKVRIQPGKIIKFGLRALSIIRIIVAALTPGSVALYWTTSAVIGLMQTWWLERLDARRRRLHVSSQSSQQQVKHSTKNNQ